MGQSFTGSTTLQYFAPNSGSYVGTCRLCNAVMWSSPMYSYGTFVYVPCFSCGRTFVSGSGITPIDVTNNVVGYSQSQFSLRKKLALNSSSP